jgi:uncharacterized protein GlcG (DUF336 family)
MRPSQDEEADRILTEARHICEEHGRGVVVTVVAAVGDQFVIIFNVASLQDETPAARDRAITTIASRLQKIRSVARVCYEVVPDKRHSH